MIFNRLKKYLILPESKAIVLMYHRVCNIDTDPWQLTVSPDNFESQIEMITKNFNVLPVTDLIEQFKNKRIKPNSVYVTFDDTYQDNYFYAKPILEKYNCPATFFVPTHYIGKEQMFWWDELEKIFLHSKTLPNQLELNINNQYFNFQCDFEELTPEIQKKQSNWHWPSTPPTNRCKLYFEIWQLLRPLRYDDISDVITSIKLWADFEAPNVPENFPMNPQQLRDLSMNKLFSLGMHTHTHPALASHSFQTQLTEIEKSMTTLKNINYKTVNAIAYPYGNYNEDTLKCINQLKIELGFTTNEAIITKHDSPNRLSRFQVVDYNGNTLHEKITKYLS